MAPGIRKSVAFTQKQDALVPLPDITMISVERSVGLAGAPGQLKKNGYDKPVLGAASVALDRNEGLQINDAQRPSVEVHGVRRSQQLRISLAVVEVAQHIDTTESGPQQGLSGARKRNSFRFEIPAGRIYNAGIQHGEYMQKAFDVCGFPVVYDVDVLCRDRCSVNDGRSTSDEDELYGRVQQQRQQLPEFSGLYGHRAGV
jgi:hypothetical protein